LGGNDILTGGAGNDTLDGGVGVDNLQGGLGADTYIVDLTVAGALQDTVTEALNAGTDTLQLRGDSTNLVATTLVLGANLENFDANATGSSKLNLTGNALNNTLTGNSAANALNGGAGADTLSGAAGSDTLIGGTGNDTLTGGADADFFVFNVAASATNRDTVTDFVSGTDVLRFDNAVFTAIGGDGALNSAAFVAGDFTGGQDTTDRIVYNTTTGALYYDADGSGAGVAVQVAMVDGLPGLAETDIFVM
jgi:Ca2+-binding RTX toxin-like protein